MPGANRPFRQYLDNIAAMHRLDVESLHLPDVVPRPKDDESTLTDYHRENLARFRTFAPGDPEPILEMGLNWVETHRPERPSRLSLCSGDIGPNQFFFVGDEVTSLFDLEMSRVTDPLFDLGMMRFRSMCYPIENLADYIRYYAERVWGALDVEILDYWTMVYLIGGALNMWDRVQRPDPSTEDHFSLMAYDCIRRRGITELFSQIYSIDLIPPEPPESTKSLHLRHEVLLQRRLTEIEMPDAKSDPAREYRMRNSAALAEMLELSHEFGPSIDRQNLEELESILGRRPSTILDGLRSLSDLIAKEPDEHLEARIQFLYRFQVREEFLVAPI